jgi:hypothetical protein
MKSEGKQMTMAHDESRFGTQDRSRINVNDDGEMRDWCATLGVNEDEVRKAVAAVGDQADKVTSARRSLKVDRCPVGMHRWNHATAGEALLAEVLRAMRVRR